MFFFLMFVTSLSICILVTQHSLSKTKLLRSLFWYFSGCFFTSSGGLTNYEHPLNELKPVPRVDSSGQVCGANFKVDSESRKETGGMPRVGSAANWSEY